VQSPKSQFPYPLRGFSRSLLHRIPFGTETGSKSNSFLYDDVRGDIGAERSSNISICLSGFENAGFPLTPTR
jgi:hypothetical protein